MWLVTLESMGKFSPIRDMEGGTRDGACTEPVGDERVTLCELKTKLNSVALVHKRTIPTERPPPVGEVSANFCG